MRKKTGVLLGLITVAFFVTACRKEERIEESINDTTEFLDVEDGLVFQIAEDEVTETTEQNLEGLVLTEEDVEGMTEERVTLVKYAKIYAKPVQTASVIGEYAKGETIGVYGKLETGKWYVVSHNGRVGYVLEKCIELEKEKPTSNQQTQNQNNSQNNNKNNNQNNQNNNHNNNQSNRPNNNITQTPDTNVDIPQNSENHINQNQSTENNADVPQIPEGNNGNESSGGSTDTPPSSENNNNGNESSEENVDIPPSSENNNSGNETSESNPDISSSSENNNNQNPSTESNYDATE